MEILRMRQVIVKPKLSRSTIYDLVKDGSFPQPFKLGARAMGWRLSDIETWINERAGVAK